MKACEHHHMNLVTVPRCCNIGGNHAFTMFSFGVSAGWRELNFKRGIFNDNAKKPSSTGR